MKITEIILGLFAALSLSFAGVNTATVLHCGSCGPEVEKKEDCADCDKKEDCSDCEKKEECSDCHKEKDCADCEKKEECSDCHKEEGKEA